MAAVDEHRELDPVGPPVVEQRVDRRAHRAPGEQDVVDEHERASAELEVEVGRVDDRLRLGLARSEIVAVERDVEVAERDLGPGQLADQGVETRGEHGAARVDSDQSEQPAGVLLDDLVSDAEQCPPQVITVEHDRLFQNAPLPGLSGPG